MISKKHSITESSFPFLLIMKSHNRVIRLPYTLLSEKAHIYASGHGRLGEAARRFYKTQLDSRFATTYYIDEFQKDGIYVEGSSEIEVCGALEQSPGFSDDEWDLMGVVDHKCYFA